MSEIQQYGGNGGLQACSSPSWSRQGRAVSRIVSSAELAVVRMAAQAHVESAKLDAIDAVTQRAMQGAAMVAQVEAQLIEAVPSAAFRLAQIGQAHTVAMVGEVQGFARGLRS